MATISGFGFSGVDHPNTFFEQWMSRKNARWNSALQWEYARKEALEGPSLRRQGLESAGYNPLLAVSGAANPLSGSVVSSGYDPNVSFGESGMPDSSALGNFVDSVKKKKLETKGQEIQNSVGEANRDAVSAQAEKIRAETRDIKASTGLKQAGMAAGALFTGTGSVLGAKKLYDMFKKPPVEDYGWNKLSARGSNVGKVSKGVGKVAKGVGKVAKGFGWLTSLLPFASSVWSAMKGAQDKAISEGRTSFTNHFSAGW